MPDVSTSIHFRRGDTNDANAFSISGGKMSVMLADVPVIFASKEQATDILSDLLIGVRNA